MLITTRTSSILLAMLLAFIVDSMRISPRSKSDIHSVPLPASNLPRPINQPLLFIAIGLGTQNFTCIPGSSTPISNGAKATLYDASPFLRGGLTVSNFTIPILPCLALSLSRLTPNLQDTWSLPILGTHYFDSNLLPVFDLRQTRENVVFHMKRGAATPAPTDTCSGTIWGDAIEWLQLLDFGDSTGIGADGLVYRVETAGGKPPMMCGDLVGDIVVPYAAEYWFYGAR